MNKTTRGKRWIAYTNIAAIKVIKCMFEITVTKIDYSIIDYNIIEINITYLCLDTFI